MGKAAEQTVGRHGERHGCRVRPIPSLRERGSDAVLIASYLPQRACKSHGRPLLRLAPDAVRAIEHHPWPGNVRELENHVNAAAIMSEGRIVSAADLSLASAGPAQSEILLLREVRQRAEAAAVHRALAVAGGNIAKAAELLGVTRLTLYDLIDQTSTPRPK